MVTARCYDVPFIGSNGNLRLADALFLFHFRATEMILVAQFSGEDEIKT